MWLVLIFSMVWVVSLAGVTLLVSCEIDQKYAECGQSALGRNVSFLCIGVLVGLAVIMFVKSFVPQFAGIVGRNSDGTMLICSMSLTPRELEVLIILAQGNTLARVQEELVISEGTAITHRRNIYRKLDVHSKQELIDFVAGS